MVPAAVDRRPGLMVPVAQARSQEQEHHTTHGPPVAAACSCCLFPAVGYDHRFHQCLPCRCSSPDTDTRIPAPSLQLQQAAADLVVLSERNEHCLETSTLARLRRAVGGASWSRYTVNAYQASNERAVRQDRDVAKSSPFHLAPPSFIGISRKFACKLQLLMMSACLSWRGGLCLPACRHADDRFY